MYEVIPKKSNKAAHYTAVVLLIAAFAAMFFSAMPNLPYRSVMQFAALVMLAFSILMMTRYTLSSYVYAIIEEDGEYDLTVAEIKRKSRITVCRIGLVGITQVTLARLADKEQAEQLKAAAKGRKTYNYCVDLAPAEYIHLLTEECGEKITIKLSYDERLFEILQNAEKQNTQVNIEP